MATEHLNCVEQAGYNVILRPQYMLLVPRAKKDFASAVNVNSFGEYECTRFVCSVLIVKMLQDTYSAVHFAL